MRTVTGTGPMTPAESRRSVADSLRLRWLRDLPNLEWKYWFAVYLHLTLYFKKGRQ